MKGVKSSFRLVPEKYIGWQDGARKGVESSFFRKPTMMDYFLRKLSEDSSRVKNLKKSIL